VCAGLNFAIQYAQVRMHLNGFGFMESIRYFQWEKVLDWAAGAGRLGGFLITLKSANDRGGSP